MNEASLLAEIISIGDEMTSGQRLDTNSQWLSQQLEQLGIRVIFHTTVGDDLAANEQVFMNAARRVHLVISTGGLGPTQDDLTRQSLANAFNAPLELRHEALAHIESLFRQRARVMPESNRLQAEFPQGSRIVPNPHGTAPGIELEVRVPSSRDSNDHCAVIFSLPGIPAEMKEMWHQTLVHRIRERFNQRPFTANAIIKCFGLGESELESHIPGMISRDHVPQVGITVQRATISLRIRAQANNQAEADEQVLRTRERIERQLGPWIFGEGEEYELQHAVTDALASRGATLQTIEFGCCSLLSGWLSELNRPEQYLGGHAFTSTAALGKILDSPQSESTWTLQVNHYPSLAWIAQGNLAEVQLTATLPSAGVRQEKTIRLGGHPDILHYRIAKTALAWFRNGLLRENWD